MKPGHVAWIWLAIAGLSVLMGWDPLTCYSALLIGSVYSAADAVIKSLNQKEPR